MIRVTINCSNNIFNSVWFRRTVQIDENIEFNDEEREVYYSVIQLPLKYLTVIYLYYYENLSITEISNILKVKEGTIRSQLSRARNMLKNDLKEEFNGVGEGV